MTLPIVTLPEAPAAAHEEVCTQELTHFLGQQALPLPEGGDSARHDMQRPPLLAATAVSQGLHTLLHLWLHRHANSCPCEKAKLLAFPCTTDRLQEASSLQAASWNVLPYVAAMHISRHVMFLLFFVISSFCGWLLNNASNNACTHIGANFRRVDMCAYFDTQSACLSVHPMQQDRSKFQDEGLP